MTKNNDIYISRQSKLNSLLKQSEYSGLILNPSPSLKYLTGMEYHLTERPVLGIFSVDNPVVLLVPELEAMKAEGLNYELEVFAYSEDPTTWQAELNKALAATSIGKVSVAVEALSIRKMELDMLAEAIPNAKFISDESLVTSLRMLKDEDEISDMRVAVKIAQTALENVILEIQAGMTEEEVSAKIVQQLFQLGSGTTLPFPPIVSSGPNGANPHAFPSDRKLVNGDLVVIDWGANINGYFSDICRTFAIGKVDDEYAKIHQIVQAANATARAVVKPGATCATVDRAARELIEKSGYGEYFFHRTGHGLGIEVHEAPYMRADNQMVLETGMTFTIEPGIYLPGKAGVRIEDDVVVTEDGVESLTDMDRGMRTIG